MYRFIFKKKCVAYHKHYFFVTSEEAPEMSLRINTVYIFLTIKSAVELNKLLLKFLLESKRSW